MGKTTLSFKNFSSSLLVASLGFSLALTSSPLARANNEDGDNGDARAHMSLEQKWELEKELKSVAPEVPSVKMSTATQLFWDDKDEPERAMWTDYSLGIIDQVFDKLDQAKDMTKFCPKYNGLTREQKLQTWAQLFASIATWESSYEPTNHTLETMGSAGIDGITHQAVYSDGLLQLSYQDSIVYPKECLFNYDADQKLKEDDVHRTTFNPYLNLYCGINIMALQVAKYQKIMIGKPAYWSTLQNGNFAENHAHEIERQVGAFPFCGMGPENVFSATFYKILSLIRDHNHEAP
jgi:hypothetical protein